MSPSNQKVRFRICDVHLPDAQGILSKLFGSQQLEGTVVGLSDNGLDDGSFAVVTVSELPDAIIVPVTQLQGV